ncbi:hypothetical protein DXT99_19945 [Pontibacter diazotrophicus]|uniref:Uncharacterized protein n=1 Tax=Pontibacter diazotrophicus TaxID=1400979 RepID=A0A3D8L7M8_9BACT|nr:hypothetical protein [Pontibacter diazotrophicus]RDV13296.1 hypothetical protein DXT99_19945 [Pontibacter diazotrophicus]
MEKAEMNIEKLLEHPFINKAAVAAALFPNQKYPKQTLNNKLNEVIAGTGKQRMTEQDKTRVRALIKRFIEEIR